MVQKNMLDQVFPDLVYEVKQTLLHFNQSINQLSKCLISVSTDSKAHHPIRKA